MVNKKNNVPYYIVGSLATLALLASGVFAAAPYVQVQFLAPILAPIAALGLSAPLIAVCAAFSAIVIALSYNAVSKNKAIAEQETQLADKTKVIEAKNKTLAEQKTQLTEKAKEVKAINETLSEKEAQLADKAKVIEAQNKTLAEQETQLADKTKVIEAQNQTLSETKAQLAEKDRMLRGEDDKSADSLFNDHNDDAKRELQKTRQDKFDRLVAKGKQEEASVLSNQSPIAPEYKDATNEPDALVAKRKQEEAKLALEADRRKQFSDGLREALKSEDAEMSRPLSLGAKAGIGATLGFACLLAQRSISSIGAIPLADNLLNPSSIMDGIAANFYAIRQIYT